MMRCFTMQDFFLAHKEKIIAAAVYSNSTSQSAHSHSKTDFMLQSFNVAWWLIMFTNLSFVVKKNQIAANVAVLNRILQKLVHILIQHLHPPVVTHSHTHMMLIRVRDVSAWLLGLKGQLAGQNICTHTVAKSRHAKKQIEFGHRQKLQGKAWWAD